jgi:hypothetical protein
VIILSSEAIDRMAMERHENFNNLAVFLALSETAPAVNRGVL